jgi:hypothetical protein
MTSVDREESCPAISSKDAEEMAKYGITRVPIDNFHYGDFRYTNLKDAIAQAKRQQRPEEGARSPDGGRSRSRMGADALRGLDSPQEVEVAHEAREG